MIVVLTLEKGSNQLLAGPDIVSRGFVYVRESEDLMEEARKVLTDAVEDCLTHQRNADWSKIKLVIRDTMNIHLNTYQEKTNDPPDHYGRIKKEKMSRHIVRNRRLPTQCVRLVLYNVRLVSL